MRHVLVVALAVGTLLLKVSSGLAQQEDGCEPIGRYRITGYTRYGGNAHTFDGTPVSNGEKVVAASWDIPIGTLVRIEGLAPVYRVADRGMLGPRHFDVMVEDVATAYALEAWTEGGYARVCVVRWGTG